MKAVDGGRHQEGFTLIEMLVVMAIIVGVAGIVSLRMNASRSARIAETTATQVLSTLKLARLEAIQTGEVRMVFLDVEKRQLKSGAEVAMAFDASVSVSFSKVRRPVGGASGDPTIIFLPDGRSSGGEVAISSGDIHRIITVNWLTGFVNEVSHAAKG